MNEKKAKGTKGDILVGIGIVFILLSVFLPIGILEKLTSGIFGFVVAMFGMGLIMRDEYK